ncbi:GRAM protein, partial [Alca torda]|nr:GRAM protein [Alca torda]
PRLPTHCCRGGVAPCPAPLWALAGSDAARHPQLKGTVTRSRTRQTIGLLGREPAAGTVCSLAGWGMRGHGGLSPTLQEMEVEVLDTRMCNNSRFWNGDITPTMICFQGRHRGSAPAKVRSWGGGG